MDSAELLATKLQIPLAQPGSVSRPRLAERLAAAVPGGAVLVCAPAGAGKTILLAAWARSGRAVAWLSLDAADNDPARFWRHLLAALNRARPGLAGRLGPLLGPPAPAAFDGLVTALVNELTADPRRGDLVLVLDDYHLIDAPAVHAGLAFLLGHRPPGLCLVLASRVDPPLPLARLRAAGELTELRLADLCFTAGEAAELLGAVTGPRADLTSELVAALTARTEGWAAGLTLAGLSLRGRPDAAGFVAAFSGSHRFVLDYLAGEVLDQQPAAVRTFLLETSVLDRLSGELCDVVTGRPGSQAMLERIERDGLFLVPQDEIRGWWRYHQLFADLLRARLRQQDPERASVLHQRAAAWLDGHGLPVDAVSHMLAAGRPSRAAQLIEMHFDALFLPGDGATLTRWLDSLPAGLVQSRPRLGLARTWLALAAGDPATARAALTAAEAATGPDEPFMPSTGPPGSLLVSVPAAAALARAWLACLAGDADLTEACAARAQAGLGGGAGGGGAGGGGAGGGGAGGGGAGGGGAGGDCDAGGGDGMLASMAQFYRAMARWLRGDLAGAEQGLAACLGGWWAARDPVWAATICYRLAQVQRARGQLDAAAGTAERALRVTGPGRGASGIGHIILAEVAYQRDDLTAALGHLAPGLERCRQFSYTQPLASGLTVLAWIRQASGDQPGAATAMAEAAQITPAAAEAGPVNPVPAQQARLLLAQGDTDGAARWARENGVTQDDDARFPVEPAHLVLARVLLASGRPGPALVLLDRLHAAALAGNRAGSVIETGALRALALAATGDTGAATGALAGALALAGPAGWVRVFADEGPPMAALLARLIAAQRAERSPARDVPLGFLARLLQAGGPLPRAAPPSAAPPSAAPPSAAPPSAAAAPALAGPLTPREREVLTLLAAGATNPHIAQDLVVTLDTAKKHVSHLLTKLGAANRTEAVSRARQLGLLP